MLTTDQEKAYIQELTDNLSLLEEYLVACPEERIFFAGSRNCCPLAVHLQEKGIPCEVGGLRIHTEREYYDLSLWEKAFVSRIDNIPDYRTRKDLRDTQVTPNEALDILRQVKADLEFEQGYLRKYM